ncbi:DUF4954 family protein [Ktedonospora formicarum]|uniref:Uncharacterized protein n=1 Tax=Ktedonospora formicarum TaxID=2778364 RepID=A0A8J3MQG3_9CHLR|nr:DUF4954 family protein [Ktedonospora formicarum]GHO42568.1 hypothetical protein KSX_07310 [Ktedonospora formicarum]
MIMNRDNPSDPLTAFNAIVDQFLRECCTLGEQYTIEDSLLFANFHAYWKHITADTSYPALLGQFRVALTQRKFHATGGKRPTWHGITLR